MRRARPLDPAAFRRIRAMILRSYLPALISIMVACAVGAALLADVRSRHRAQRDSTTKRLQKHLSTARTAAVGFVRLQESKRRELEARIAKEAEILAGDVLRRLETSIREKEAAIAERGEIAGRTSDAGWAWLERILPIGRTAPQDPPPPNWPEMLLIQTLQPYAENLPPTATVAVFARNGQRLHGLEGSCARAEGLTVDVGREMQVSAAGRMIAWTIRVRLVAPEAPDAVTAENLAHHLGHSVFPRGDPGTLRGLLLDRAGGVVAVFPAGTASELPRLERPGAWIRLLDGQHLARLEKIPAGDNLAWGLGMLGTFRDPGLFVLTAERLMHDPVWGVGLGVPALLGAFAFGQASRLRRRAVEDGSAAPDAGLAGTESPTLHSGAPRLRRQAGAAPPTRAGITLAEVEESDGVSRLHLRELPFVPSGNLLRLQAWHRGSGAPGQGSRILDHARSPILRELVAKVRPRGADSGLRSAGRASEKPPSPLSDVGGRDIVTSREASAAASPSTAETDPGWAPDGEQAEEQDAMRMADRDRLREAPATRRVSAEERLRAALSGARERGTGES